MGEAIAAILGCHGRQGVADRLFSVAPFIALGGIEVVHAALEGMPAVYEINGREYIVFCAAAQVGLIPATQGKVSGAYIAFALPASTRNR